MLCRCIVGENSAMNSSCYSDSGELVAGGLRSECTQAVRLRTCDPGRAVGAKDLYDDHMI